MIPELRKLSDAEQEFIAKSPILVCILIAGADGTIDRKEVNEAIEQAKKRQGQFGISDFYKEVGEDFEDKLKIVLREYPSDPSQRNPKVVEELKRLNDIMPKLDKDFSIKFYISLREIALKIAQSSGGILGMKSIGKEESHFVELPMLVDPSAK
jgi:hypothetical protein